MSRAHSLAAVVFACSVGILVCSDQAAIAQGAGPGRPIGSVSVDGSMVSASWLTIDRIGNSSGGLTSFQQ